MKNEFMKELIEGNQNLNYFHILGLIYLSVMITALTVSARLVYFHIPLTHWTVLVSGGTWIIPFSFFVQDITTEVYGYAKSRQLIQLTILILLIYIFYLKITTFFPTPEFKNINYSYDEVFHSLPKHLLALIVAIFASNLVSDYLLSKSKNYFNGKYLAGRFIISSAIGSLILQFVGTTTAWLGDLKFNTQILPFVVFSYSYKIIFEVVTAPVGVYICRWLKNAENIDIYDKNTNYNPFIFK
jgi:queuosine precursor transporter